MTDLKLYVNPLVVEFERPFNKRQSHRVELLNGSVVMLGVRISWAQHSVIRLKSPGFVCMSPGDFCNIEIMCDSFDTKKPPKHLEWPILITFARMDDTNPSTCDLLGDTATVRSEVVSVIIKCDAQKANEIPPFATLRSISFDDSVINKATDFEQQRDGIAENEGKIKSGAKMKGDQTKGRLAVGDSAEKEGEVNDQKLQYADTAQNGPSQISVGEAYQTDTEDDPSAARAMMTQLNSFDAALETERDSMTDCQTSDTTIKRAEKNESVECVAAATDNQSDAYEKFPEEMVNKTDHQFVGVVSERRAIAENEQLQTGKKDCAKYESKDNASNISMTTLLNAEDGGSRDEFTALQYSTIGEEAPYVVNAQLEPIDKMCADRGMSTPTQITYSVSLATPPSIITDVVNDTERDSFDTMLQLPEFVFQDNKTASMLRRKQCATARCLSSMDNLNTAEQESDFSDAEIEIAGDRKRSPDVCR